MFNIVILNSENELLLADIKNECQKEKWIPVACQEKEDNKIILLFNGIDNAKNFIRRNFSKGQLVGLVILGENDLKNIKDNYYFEELNWPKKMNNINFEIIEFECNPLLKVL